MKRECTSETGNWEQQTRVQPAPTRVVPQPPLVQIVPKPDPVTWFRLRGLDEAIAMRVGVAASEKILGEKKGVGSCQSPRKDSVHPRPPADLRDGTARRWALRPKMGHRPPRPSPSDMSLLLSISLDATQNASIAAFSADGCARNEPLEGTGHREHSWRRLGDLQCVCSTDPASEAQHVVDPNQDLVRFYVRLIILAAQSRVCGVGEAEQRLPCATNAPTLDAPSQTPTTPVLPLRCQSNEGDSIQHPPIDPPPREGISPRVTPCTTMAHVIPEQIPSHFSELYCGRLGAALALASAQAANTRAASQPQVPRRRPLKTWRAGTGFEIDQNCRSSVQERRQLEKSSPDASEERQVVATHLPLSLGERSQGHSIETRGRDKGLGTVPHAALLASRPTGKGRASENIEMAGRPALLAHEQKEEEHVDSHPGMITRRPKSQDGAIRSQGGPDAKGPSEVKVLFHLGP